MLSTINSSVYLHVIHKLNKIYYYIILYSLLTETVNNIHMRVRGQYVLSLSDRPIKPAVLKQVEEQFTFVNKTTWNVMREFSSLKIESGRKRKQ